MEATGGKDDASLTPMRTLLLFKRRGFVPAFFFWRFRVWWRENLGAEIKSFIREYFYEILCLYTVILLGDACAIS